MGANTSLHLTLLVTAAAWQDRSAVTRWRPALLIGPRNTRQLSYQPRLALPSALIWTLRTKPAGARR